MSDQSIGYRFIPWCMQAHMSQDQTDKYKLETRLKDPQQLGNIGERITIIANSEKDIYNQLAEQLPEANKKERFDSISKDLKDILSLKEKNPENNVLLYSKLKTILKGVPESHPDRNTIFEELEKMKLLLGKEKKI